MVSARNSMSPSAKLRLRWLRNNLDTFGSVSAGLKPAASVGGLFHFKSSARCLLLALRCIRGIAKFWQLLDQQRTTTNVGVDQLRSARLLSLMVTYDVERVLADIDTAVD